jgi:hypothetical protein
MIGDELNVKYLSESRILRYLRNESSNEEKIIVEKLRSLDINWENYSLIKEMYAKGEFNKSDESSEKYKNDYNKFIELVKNHHKPDPDILTEFQRLKNITEPKAGQIWLTKAIPLLGGYEFEPVALPKYVYILTNPQPYQALDEQDKVKTIEEYFTIFVLPVSLNTEFATHEDYIINPGNNILSIEFMIETWLETNMIVCNLEKCIGVLNDNQIDELLNVYFASNVMEYDKEIYKRAKRGNFHDKDYGDIYEFQHIEEENVEYLYKPVEKLEEFFTNIDDEEIINNIYKLLEDPVEVESASDPNIITPSQQEVYAEFALFSDNNYELKLLVLEQGQLYFRFKIKKEPTENEIFIIYIKNKTDKVEIQKIDKIENIRRPQYLHINKILKDHSVEFIFMVNGIQYFSKYINIKNENKND